MARENVCVGPYGDRFMTVNDKSHITIILYPNDFVSPTVTNVADKLQTAFSSILLFNELQTSLQKCVNITGTVLKLSI